MNDLNSVEKQLRSWKPRRPSPAVKARLFPRAVENDSPLSLPLRWGWLAPAMAALIFTTLLLVRDPRALNAWPLASTTSLVATVAVASPNLVAYFDSTRHSDRNAWPGTTFAWTNTGQSMTTTATATLFRTNISWR